MSNTFMYERCFNWTGLLIEAQPDNFESLQYHSGRQSTKILSAVCASGTDPPVVRMTRPQSGHGNVAKQVKVSGINTVEVPCAPLSTIIDSTGLSREDIVFFSLDVEGAELDVLRTVSPSRFKIIMVETELNVKGVGQVSDRKTIEQVHQTIVSHGFRMAADHANINDANYNKNKVYRRRDVATPQRHWYADITSFVSHMIQSERARERKQPRQVQRQAAGVAVEALPPSPDTIGAGEAMEEEEQVDQALTLGSSGASVVV